MPVMQKMITSEKSEEITIHTCSGVGGWGGCLCTNVNIGMCCRHG